jgi:hypothetical protein
MRAAIEITLLASAVTVLAASGFTRDLAVVILAASVGALFAAHILGDFHAPHPGGGPEE